MAPRCDANCSRPPFCSSPSRARRDEATSTLPNHQHSPVWIPPPSSSADLIRIDTSNPPGHEQRIADFLGPKFSAARLRDQTSSRRRKRARRTLRSTERRRQPQAAPPCRARRRRRRRAGEVERRSVCRNRQRRHSHRTRRHRLQGRDGGVRARGDDARRKQGAARARRDLPGGSRTKRPRNTTRRGSRRAMGRRWTASSP